MKNLYTIFLLSFFISNAQIKNGSVDYKIISNLINKNETVEFIINENNKIFESTKIVNYTLNFNQSSSYFFINPVLLKNYSNIDEFSISIGTKSKFYTKPSNDEYLYYINNDLIGLYVMDYKQEVNWTLTNETKMIGNYLCYKATSPHYNEDGWNDNPKLLVTAWYTPKIPVHFGPNGYGGLPGLILELSNIKYTLFVKNVNLNLDKDPEIDNLSSIRKLSKYQREKLIKQALNVDQLKWYEEQQAIIAKKKAEKSNTTIPK